MALNKAVSFILFGIIPLALVFGLETLYRAPLYGKTINEVPLMQKKKSLHNFMFNVSLIAEFIMPPLAFISVFNLIHKISATFIWSAISLAVYLNILLKSFYA
jgi:hypothetical protein